MPISPKAAGVLKLNSYWFKIFRKASSAAIKRFPKAASTHIKNFEKTDGVDYFSQASS
jgi:hypothetical protein